VSYSTCKKWFKSFGMIISIFRMKYPGQSKKVGNELKENPCQIQSELANALTSDPTSFLYKFLYK